MQHASRDAAQKALFQTRMAVTSHNHQIEAFIGCDRKYELCNIGIVGCQVYSAPLEPASSEMSDNRGCR